MGGADVYNKLILSVYDKWVLGFSNRYAWRCPTRLILSFYNEHIRERHLDVGVGTGYFLNKCRMPAQNPILALIDLNPNSLQMAADRLQRYNPMTHIANVLEPLPIESKFDSIALNYLLHCLPGNIISKGNIVFGNLKPLLNQNGVVFGTTILGKGSRQNFLARVLSYVYNSKGIFSNTDDNVADLESVLKDNFRSYFFRVMGSVAFFVGRSK